MTAHVTAQRARMEKEGRRLIAHAGKDCLSLSAPGPGSPGGQRGPAGHQGGTAWKADSSCSMT